VFITADAVLRQAAGVQPGEVLFLPAAAGGVGFAGMQVCVCVCVPFHYLYCPALLSLSAQTLTSWISLQVMNFICARSVNLK
jgi:hypothetical protein